MNAATFTKSGAKATTPAKLDKNVFGIEVQSHDLLKQAYLAYLANGRENFAVVKTRGLVRGGGKKPWKQKGTGRARFGSSRNPIWRGGGIVFGPTGSENYSRKLNTTAKRVTLRQALSLKAKIVNVVEAIDVKDGKVKSFVGLLDKLQANRNVLVIVEEKTAELERASRNVPYVKLVQARYVNVYDVLNADSIVVTKKALEVIHEWLGGDK
jgi:large subunit ribosomal protein L4